MKKKVIIFLSCLLIITTIFAIYIGPKLNTSAKPMSEYILMPGGLRRYSPLMIDKTVWTVNHNGKVTVYDQTRIGIRYYKGQKTISEAELNELYNFIQNNDAEEPAFFVCDGPSYQFTLYNMHGDVVKTFKGELEHNYEQKIMTYISIDD